MGSPTLKFLAKVEIFTLECTGFVVPGPLWCLIYHIFIFLLWLWFSGCLLNYFVTIQFYDKVLIFDMPHIGPYVTIL